MKSEYYIDQPKVLVFYGRQTPKEEVDELIRELCQRFMDLYVKALPVEKIPEIVASVNPQQISTVVLMTKEMEPTPNLLEAVGRLSATNSVVIMYPRQLPNTNPAVITAPSSKQLFRAVSEQWDRYISNRSFNNGKLGGTVMPTDAQRLGSSPVATPNQMNIGGAYLMSALGGGNQNPNPPMISPNLPNPPMQTPPAGLPIMVCILNQRADPQYNDLVNTLKGKYSGNPHVQFKEFQDMRDLMNTENIGGQHNLLLVGGLEAPMVANRLSDFQNRGIQNTVIYHPTMAIDPSLTQAFRYTVQDYPTMDRIINDRLNTVMMHPPTMPNQQQTVYQTTTINRSPSAPHSLVGNNLMVSQIMDQQAVHAMTNQKFQQQKYQQQQYGTMVGNVQQTTLTRTSRVSAPSGRMGLNRPMTVDSLRLNSARRLQKRKWLSKHQPQPLIYVLDYADKSLRPTFVESVEYLGITPACHHIRDLNTSQQKFSSKSIMLAPYDRRMDLRNILNNKENKGLAVILFGQKLDPDPVVSHPQVELVTNSFKDIASYLHYRGVKLNPTKNPPPPTMGEPTSIAVLPLQQYGVPMSGNAALLAQPTTPMFNQNATGNMWQDNKPLSVIVQQNSAMGSNVRATPMAPVMNYSNDVRRISPPSIAAESVQGSPVLVQRTSFTQIAPPQQSVKMLQQPLGVAVQQHMTVIGMNQPQLGHSFASVPPPPGFAVMNNQYAKEWVVRRNPQVLGSFITASTTNQPGSNSNLLPGGKQVVTNFNNPWNSMTGTIVGSDRSDLPRITPQFQGPIPFNPTSPNRNSNGNPSEINITSNQSIIDQQLGPGIRQSQNTVMGKQSSLSNIPMQHPPTGMSNIISQGPNTYNGPVGGTRPLSRTGRNEGVEEAQVASTLSGVSQYSSDPNDLNSETRVRRKIKKKKPAYEQSNNQDNLFPITEEDKRGSAVLSDPSLNQQNRMPSQVDLPMQTPPQTSMQKPGFVQSPVQQPPNGQLQHFSQSRIVQLPMLPPPQLRQYPTTRSRMQVNIRQNPNQPPHLQVSQQSFQNNPNIRFVKDPRISSQQTPNEYLTTTTQQVRRAPPPFVPLPLTALNGQPDMPPFTQPIVPPNMNGTTPGYQPNYDHPHWQTDKYEVWQGPGPQILPQQQIPIQPQRQPPQLTPQLQPAIGQRPGVQQPQTYDIPFNKAPSSAVTQNNKPAPARPLTPPDMIESPSSSYNNLPTPHEIPVLNIMQSSSVKEPPMNYFPSREEKPATPTTKYYPSTAAVAPTLTTAVKAREPTRQIAKLVEGRDSQVQTNEYELMPTGNYGTVYDSIAKYTNSTSYEPRDHNYFVPNPNQTSRNSIRISSNNLEHANKTSTLSHQQGDYDVRMENGIKIISRKQPRASSLDGSPKRQIHQYLGKDNAGGTPSTSRHIYGTTVENRASRNYVKYTSDNYNVHPEDYVTSTNQHYYGSTPQKVIERVSYMPDYRYQTVPLDSYEPPRARSLDAEEIRGVRYSQTVENIRSNDAYGVLYMCPRNSNIIHKGLYKVCTPFDKIRMYSSNDQLKLVKCKDYGAVIVFPLDERKLPQVSDPNVFFVLMNTPSRGSRQIALKDLNELKQIAAKYHKAPLVTAVESEYRPIEPTIRPSHRISGTPAAPVVTSNGEYKVLLRQDLRRDVQLDAFIQPEHFTLNNLQDKIHRYHNYIIIVGQEDVQYVRPHKKQTDKIMVLGRSHHQRVRDAHLWTQDPREIEQAVKQAMSYRKLIGSPTSMSSNNSRPKIYYSVENPEIEEQVADEFGEQVDLVKYFDFSSLLSKLKQNRDDYSVVVLNRNLAHNLAALRSNIRRGKFLLYDRRAYGMDTYDSDVIETPTVSAVVRTIRSLL